MARAYIQPATASAPLRMSYEEWLAWYGTHDLNRGEWVQGEVVPYMPPLIPHVRIVGLLYALMLFYARHRKLGEVFSESAELWMPGSQAARMPDICFLSNQHADRLSVRRLEGYADLVVEVISRDSVTRDQRQKFAEYQAAGIPEYWTIDSRPRRQDATIYYLDANGQYQVAPADRRGRLVSRVMAGFWIDPAWLWQEELPDPLQLLHEILADADRWPSTP
jgi:Uma2 family endonuclease